MTVLFLRPAQENAIISAVGQKGPKKDRRNNKKQQKQTIFTVEMRILRCYNYFIRKR